MEDVIEWMKLLTGCSPMSLLIDGLAYWRRSEAAMTNTAYVVHHIPGRIRLRVPSRRDDLEFFRNVEHRLQACPGVSRMYSNPETASILVYYEGELPELLLHATDAGLAKLIQVEVGLPPLKPVSERLLDLLGNLGRGISHQSNGAIDGKSAVVGSLLIAGVVQLARGQILGPAVPLLWYAAQALGNIWPDRVAGRQV